MLLCMLLACMAGLYSLQDIPMIPVGKRSKVAEGVQPLHWLPFNYLAGPPLLPGVTSFFSSMLVMFVGLCSRGHA